MRKQLTVCLLAVLLTGCAQQTTSDADIPQTTTAAETTVTAAETTSTETTAAPLPTDADLLHDYAQNVLLPQYGEPVFSAPADRSACIGLAAAYIAALSADGADEMLVIRLALLDETSAAVPVLEWYGVTQGEIVLLDEFACIKPWSKYTVRLEQQTLYVSGMQIGEDAAAVPEYTEIAIAMDAHDMSLLDIETAAGLPPERAYSEDAQLLLEMQLDETADTSVFADRQYILRAPHSALHSSHSTLHSQKSPQLVHSSAFLRTLHFRYYML